MVILYLYLLCKNWLHRWLCTSACHRLSSYEFCTTTSSTARWEFVQGQSCKIMKNKTQENQEMKFHLHCHPCWHILLKYIRNIPLIIKVFCTKSNLTFSESIFTFTGVIPETKYIRIDDRCFSKSCVQWLEASIISSVFLRCACSTMSLLTNFHSIFFLETI